MNIKMEFERSSIFHEIFACYSAVEV